MEFVMRARMPGTYVKVIQFDQSLSGDAYLILYLLDSGFYLFIGYWRGYELTVTAGRWIEHQDRVELEGVGRILSIDTAPFSSAFQDYRREFSIKIDNKTPILVAESEQSAWSLLSWAGQLTYIGKHYFFDLKDDRLPIAWRDIETWVRMFLGSNEEIS